MVTLSFLPPVVTASFFMLAGFVLLLKGGDWTVQAGAWLGKSFGVPILLIGFTVVAFGTSLPEMFVSVDANLDGAPGLALGNVIGSNIANILLILGVCAVIAPLPCAGNAAMQRDLWMMLAATAALILLMLTGIILFWQGWILLAILFLYVTYQYRRAKQTGEVPFDEGELDLPQFSSRWLASGLLLIGLISVMIGARLLVTGSVFIAQKIGVPDAVIGLTLVAFGTSLPELATCVAAVRQNHNDMIFGNIVGSNVFNILFIIGVAAGLKSILVPAELVGADLIFLAAVTVGFMFWALYKGHFGRITGVVMLLLYATYILFQYTRPLLFSLSI